MEGRPVGNHELWTPGAQWRGFTGVEGWRATALFNFREINTYYKKRRLKNWV